MNGTEVTIETGHTTPPSGNLCVLVLDDSEFDRTRMRRLIAQADRTVEVITCSDIHDFEKALGENVVDLCLVDHHLRDASGLDAVAVVKKQLMSEEVPVVMISGREDTEAVVSSIRAGCVDYVGKGNLTAEKLHGVIYNSIAETFSNPALKSEVQAATRNVIRGMAQGCISELQPKLRRMYRQISFIRACHAQGLTPSPEALNEIEDHCLNIWRFFDEIESYSNNFNEIRH
ncbi:response regulator [Phaeobacter porticola]|uniref:Putative response regulator n=1 Tax=Phaeobacter porticola TaxID=1844006 RepID=A0A1L3I7C1_9RHOB|nr:response regulator [Phaeobacter porticola]APG48048.1 putative response regulator [Phaeobacter porticola]